MIKANPKDSFQLKELPPSKAIMYSPLLGGVIVSIIFNIYAFLLLMTYYQINDLSFSNKDFFINLLLIIPTVFTITNIFSYLIFIPSLFFLKYLQKKYEIKEKILWFYIFIFGLVIGALLGVFAFEENNIARTVILSCSIGFGLLFNLSLYSTLTKKV